MSYSKFNASEHELQSTNKPRNLNTNVVVNGFLFKFKLCKRIRFY